MTLSLCKKNYLNTYEKDLQTFKSRTFINLIFSVLPNQQVTQAPIIPTPLLPFCHTYCLLHKTLLFAISHAQLILLPVFEEYGKQPGDRKRAGIPSPECEPG